MGGRDGLAESTRLGKRWTRAWWRVDLRNTWIGSRKRNACLWKKPLKEKKVKIPLLEKEGATGGIGDEKREPIEPLENDQKEFSFL